MGSVDNSVLILVIIGGLFIFLALVLGKYFNVIDILDDISGRKSKRQLKQIKKMNSQSGMLSSMSTGEVYRALQESKNSSSVESTKELRNDSECKKPIEKVEVKPQQVVTQDLSRGKQEVRRVEPPKVSTCEEPDFEVVDEQPPEVNNHLASTGATGYLAEEELSTFISQEELTRVAHTGVVSSIYNIGNKRRNVKVLKEQTSI